MGEHVLFRTGIRRLGSKDRGFFYRYPGTEETVREERVLTRIENLKVPPAWEDAHIAQGPSAKVQAVGYDSEGRLQYLYHPNYRARKEREKFDRILRFADALPEMRRITTNHLRHKYLDREKVLAAMTRLMNAAYFRVGEERYAKNNRTYGITTLRRKHLRVEGNTMIFEYTGKWGKQQRKAITDAKAAEKNVLSAVDAVAERLGNTRDIARASYISPRVIDHYMEGSVIAYYGERLEEIIAAEQGGLTEGEEALLELLNRKLRRELRKAA